MAIVERKREVPPSLLTAQRRVLSRLNVVRQRLRLHLLVEGLFWFLAATFVLAAASLMLDRLFRFELSTRLALLALGAGALVWVAVQRLVRPALVKLDDLDLAELLNRRAPGVGQQIANVLQLPELLASGQFASPAMVQAAVLECAQSLDRTDLSGTLNASRRRKLLIATGLILALAIGFAVLAPRTASLWAQRWMAGSTVRWPQRNYLNMVGLDAQGRLLVPRGELTVVQFTADPKFVARDGRWWIAGRKEPLASAAHDAPLSAPPSQVSMAYRMPDGTRRQGTAAQFAAAEFRYELPPLAEPIDVDVWGGDDWFGPVRVEPIDRPGVRSIEITSKLPGASESKTERVDEGGAQLLFLPQTELELRLVADQALQSAQVLDKGTPLSGWRRVDERTYALNWTMQEPLSLEFQLTGPAGGLLSKPYALAIGLLKDREPRVTIRSSGVGRRVTPMARIPLAVRANDDFGLASLALEWERTVLREEKPTVDTGRQPKETDGDGAPASLGLEQQWNYEWSLRERNFAPGSAVKVRGAATDACRLGAQQGHSRWLLLQVVAPDELFYEILMRQREQRAKFTAALENEKVQAAALGAPAENGDAAGIARAQQVIARQVSQITSQLDATLVELTLNDLGTSQARDNLQTAILTPLRSLHADVLSPLRAACDEMARQASPPPERRAEALELSQQAIETMQKILAQMSLWESFIDVVNQLKHVIDRQGDVLKSTEEVEKKRTDELFDP